MKLKLESIANLLLVGGAVLVSVSPVIAAKWWLFLLFLFGHAVWVWHAKRTGDSQLIQLNVAMVGLDIYAMAIRVVDADVWSLFSATTPT